MSLALDEEDYPVDRNLLYSSTTEILNHIQLVLTLYDRIAFDHGASFNRFCHCVFGYAGPTVLIIKDSKNNVFGAYTTACKLSCPFKLVKKYNNSLAMFNVKIGTII